jgi:fluoride exporter
MVARSHRGPWASEPVRLLLTTGAMGGFTTYSTFNTEVIALWSQGRGVEAAGYLAATVAGCLVGGWLGWIWAATAPD